jgi:hypothetical protein
MPYSPKQPAVNLKSRITELELRIKCVQRRASLALFGHRVRHRVHLHNRPYVSSADR